MAEIARGKDTPMIVKLLAARTLSVALVVAVLAGSLTLGAAWRALLAHSFQNPIVAQGQDPSVVYFHGSYYLAQSDVGATGITITQSATLTGLGGGPRVTILGSTCCQIWAPELVPLDGKWYIYYAASTGDNATHRMYVLESAGDDPLGPYHSRGKIAPATDAWAIDGTVLRMGSSRYFVWSGWPGVTDGQQNLYIARMSNPWTLTGDRSLLAAPTSAWERPGAGLQVRVEEGPEALQHNGKTFLIYSARGSWSDDYCLAMLTHMGGDVTSAASWTKSPGCVFAKDVGAGVFGPGHSSFTQSPNGAEDWLIYHADAVSGAGWDGRSIRAQRFTWNRDGTPHFGTPVSTDTWLARPAGEPAR